MYCTIFVKLTKSNTTSKGKAVPLEAWSGPEGSRKLRFPDFLTTAQDGRKVVRFTHRPHLPPGNTPGTHICYRLSHPQGYSAIRRIYVNEKFHDTSWDATQLQQTLITKNYTTVDGIPWHWRTIHCIHRQLSFYKYFGLMMACLGRNESPLFN
jgi:hypothetical protein